MNDRLEEVMTLAKQRGDIGAPEEPEILESDKELLSYIAQIQLVQRYTAEIQMQLSRLRIIKEELVTAVGKNEKELISETEQVMDGVVQQQGKTNHLLKSLNELLTTAKKNDPENKNSTTRIKANLYGSYMKLFQETMTEFEDVQTEVKSRMEGKVVRDAEIVLNRKIDPQEREMVLQDQQYVQKLLAEKLTGTAHIKLQNAVNDIEERYRDIVKLENSVNQVHKLFMEMAILVKHQGEIIDNIESNIKDAKGHVIKAEKNIIEAKKNIISARKKKCCILIIVLVILLCIIMPILGVKYF